MIVNASGSTTRKYHVGMPENNSLPDIFSSIMNTHEARVKKQQTVPETALIRIFRKTLSFLLKNRDKISMLICFSYRVVNAAPIKAIHNTRCLRKISAHGIPPKNMFLRTTCRKEKITMKERIKIRRNSSILAK